MEVMQSIRELQALPPSLHLLCPRKRRDDFTRYEEIADEKDESGITVAQLLEEAKERRQKSLSALVILAFQQDGVEELQQWLWRRLDDAMESCDACIRQYYLGKSRLLEDLKETYDDEDIEKFARMLDDWDVKRVTRNLTNAEIELKAASPENIGLHILTTPSLLSLFECLSCEPMLRSEALLREYFDNPFRLIQTKRTLKITDYVPAATYFLFDPDQSRSFWAVHAWAKLPHSPTNLDFEWAVKKPLLRALTAASQQPPDATTVQRLWRGLRSITLKLDKEQITHNLRALDIDPCRLSVEHLAIPSPGLKFLLNTIQNLLEKAPADFWDAMQTISPQAIVEQTFYNPQLDAFLRQATKDESFSKSALKDMLSWVLPFMSSLKGINRTPACRYLVAQLFNRFQNARYPSISRYHCFQTGLTVLLHTLRSFTDNEFSRGSSVRVVLTETLAIVNEHINIILEPPKFDLSPDENRQIVASCMDVVKSTLGLECQSLKTDYEVILNQNTLQHGVSTYSPGIWDAVVSHLHENNRDLSTAALGGILNLVGLEKFPMRGDDSREKKQYNVTFGHLTHLSCQIIERLADFNPDHLDELFASQDTSTALISTLFSADLNTYQAAVDLIKQVSGQSARRDAISHLLQSFFTTTVQSLTWSFRRISNMKTFAPAPRMLHTGTDIMDILCDTQTGILRSRKLTDRREVTEIQKFWRILWQALETMFVNTESWHLRGNDKSVMLEFCRDTIQFADLLFAQYGVFASAIAGANSGEDNSARESLMQAPTGTMSGMVKWLRLKDDYLATTLVGVVSRVLRRLGELNVTTVRADALEFIEDVAVTSAVKTILSPREKAELVRALEAYYKKPVVTASTASLKKQSRITAFTKTGDTSSRSTPAPTTIEDDFEDPSVSDDVLMQLSRSVELNKARRAADALKKSQAAAKSPLVIPKPPGRPSPSIESFREKREKEREAKRKRDLAELARLKKNIPADGVAEATAEQGSGVLGIGVKGKDHTPVDGMMVSSESESEDEIDGEVDAELFGNKDKWTPTAVREYEESKKRSLRLHGPVKKVRQLRSAKDMRARLAPDLSSLHRTILGWDFFASGDLPPSSDRTDYTLISSTFRDPIEYQRTFEPLLILEAWQGFQSSKEEGNFKPFEIVVATRLSVDSFIEVCTTMKIPDLKDIGVGEADIVLLSKSKNPVNDKSASHCLARVSGINRKKGNVEISYRLNPGNSIVSSIAPGVSLWGARISSLTPLEREYGALMALQYYDLCDEIIRAKPSPILRYSDASLSPIADNYSVNQAQAKAIKSAIDNDAFTLIQGPPGSGKTKTIVALVGALLTNSFGSQGVSIPRPTGNKAPSNAARTTTAKKLLVCAPSNAAVDELVMRLKEGVKTLQGKSEKLSVIRLGRSDAINSNVIDVTLDELVNARLSQNPRKDSGERDLQKIYEEHKATDTSFKEVRSKLDRHRAQGLEVPSDLEREFDLLKKKRTQLSQEIDNARDRNHTKARDADLTRRRVQQEIIDGAHVICATLSGSGHEMFQNLSIEFETVVIDEAAQSIELSALIPLKYGCAKCILVGDPKQLPPTVLSKAASRFQYEQSLFVRMQSNHPNDVHLLDVQYRMHPEISRFPSLAFYDRRLQDGPDMAKLRSRPWHQSSLLSPYRFFDVQGLHEGAVKGHSLINKAEVKVAMQLYERVVTDFKTYDFAGKVGIITPYKGQLRQLKAEFLGKYGQSIFTAVDFNTTDAFQGRESEVIIFSCVRASNKGIGFLSDIRRMNVGLTRAKSSLWVLGNSRSLMQGEFWNKLILDAQDRNIYTNGDVLRLLQRPQFSGYKNVDMADADISGSIGSPAASKGPSSAPTPTDAHLSNEMESVSARNTPGPILDGPSGGYNGLNDNKSCGVCGSFDHFTHNCDNAEALEAARGICYRCGLPGHTKAACKATRCTTCGGIGHLSDACNSTQPVPKRDQKRIRQEEFRHQQIQNQRREHRLQQHMKNHDPKVPVIQVTTKSPPPENRAHSGSPAPSAPSTKRKLPQSGPLAKNTKRKLDAQIPQQPTADLVKPSRDGPSYQAMGPNTKNPTGSGPISENKNPLPPRPPAGGKAGNGVRPPMPMRRKKEVDPFIRPKRR